jgi:protein-S-isoprenylcysteine O-methyltransferase Ste14
MASLLFGIPLVCLLSLVGLLVIDVLIEKVTIWPPPQKASWQYHLVWTLFRSGVLSAFVLSFFVWDSFIVPDSLRWRLGFPLFMLGMGIAFYGYVRLGLGNSRGLAEGLYTNGLYRYSRNPQYVAAILGFIGTALWVNAWQMVVICGLLSLLYVLLPFLEEPWLYEQYGEAYAEYRNRTPRFH